MRGASLEALFARQRLDDGAAITEAVLRSDRFRKEREADWQRLETIIVKIEKGRYRRLSDDDVLALPMLYRTAASSLAVAREISLDRATIDYLEALVQRAWYQVYGPRVGFFSWLSQFFGGGLSRAVRSIWLDIWIAFSVMVAGTLVGWILVSRDEAWFYRFMPSSMSGGRTPDASQAALRETLGGGEGEPLGVFAAYLLSNNAGVAILAFALGFAFGIPSLLLLVHNTALLGAMLWLFFSKGLGIEFVGWLSIHGTTELFAILLAGAAGLHIGRSMAFPGERSIMTAAAESGRRSAQVMTGVVVMLICAALLEGFGRQLVVDTTARYVVGGAMLLFWLLYFFAYRPVARSGHGVDEWRDGDFKSRDQSAPQATGNLGRAG